MRFISWNVNGFRACLSKGFSDFFNSVDADVFAIQETKMSNMEAKMFFSGYNYYLNCADKKGYSGTLIYTKEKPLNVFYGLLDGKYNDEGRVITLEFPTYYFINMYVPNSQEKLKRLDYRLRYQKDLLAYLASLNKPVILCGDLNVAHNEIDLKNPATNHNNAGFSDAEREAFSELLASGLVDTFRYLHPERIKYSWWSYRTNARSKGIGWRIDYFLVSNSLADRIKLADIFDQVEGSDHAPVVLDICI